MADNSFSRQVRHYTVWPSKNKFCCKGRFITGPAEDIGSHVCVWIMLIVPTIAFYSFCAPILLRSSAALPIVVAIFFFWAVVFLVMTSYSDPGILPRRSMLQLWQEIDEEVGPLRDRVSSLERQSDRHSDSETEDTGAIISRSAVSTVVSSPSDNGERKNAKVRDNGTLWEREIDGERHIYKWCSTCQIWRPPRASHCQYCDNCIKEFDHHCPFVMNCIGERNYGSFMLFNLSVVALLMAVIASVFTALESGENGSHTATIIGIVAVCVFSLIMFCIMFSFFGFHCWLIITGHTTKEQMKQWRGNNRKDDNTVDDGGGVRTLQCFRRSTSLIRPRYYVDPQLATAQSLAVTPRETDDDVKSTPPRRSSGPNRSRRDGDENSTIFHPK